jgi:hypothetical protein
MSTATVWVEDGELKLRFPYDAHIIDQLKERFCAAWRWYDKKRRIWSITLGQRAAAESFCREHFGKVVFLGELPMTTEEQPKLAALLDSLSPDLVAKVYKLLLFETHPDRGGDADTFRKVQDAYGAWKGIICTERRRA